jgi:ATP-dependent Clp protease, protease subunit
MKPIEIIKSIPAIITINDVISNTKTTKVTNDLFRGSEKGISPVLLHLNTIGGDLATAFSIISVMKAIHSDVYTYVSGEAMSAGALIAMSGKRGYRFADRNSSIMIHYAQGFQSVDESVENFTKRINDCNKKIINHVHTITGQSKSVIKDYLKNQNVFTAKEAVRFGLIDKII